jgi:hypothetical protein
MPLPITHFVVSPKRCESLIRFSILRRTTWIPSRQRRILRKPKETCCVPRRFSLRCSPNADDSSAVETQVYQAILERRPAQIIPRLKEILAKPDPALGYINSKLRFWLGWAQEVAGDHTAAQETWRQARNELESFLKEQPENYRLIGDLALTYMGSVTKSPH